MDPLGILFGILALGRKSGDEGGGGYVEPPIPPYQPPAPVYISPQGDILDPGVVPPEMIPPGSVPLHMPPPPGMPPPHGIPHMPPPGDRPIPPPAAPPPMPSPMPSPMPMPMPVPMPSAPSAPAWPSATLTPLQQTAHIMNAALGLHGYKKADQPLYKSFQKAAGLTADGFPGKGTMGKLAAALLQTGEPMAPVTVYPWRSKPGTTGYDGINAPTLAEWLG